MNNKAQKYHAELEKIEAKMTALKERGKALEQKIREVETLEICALMRSEGITLNELAALARSRKENHELPIVPDTQTNVADEEADEQEAAENDDAASRRKEYWEEDEDDEDDDE